MKNWKRLAALLLSLALIASLCACGTAQPTGGDPSASDSPSLSPSDPSAAPTIEVDLTQDALAFSANLSADDALITVNGDSVYADLLLYWLALSCDNFMSIYGMMGYQLTDSPDGQTTFADQMLESAVSIAAYNILLQQKAAELGCLPTDAQVEEAHSSMESDNYDLLKSAFGLTDDSLEYLLLSDAYYENVLNAVVPAVTDEQLNNYAYQAKHILIKTIDDNRQPLPDDQIAEKQKQAEDILAQLQAADDLEAKFDELMNEYSEDGRTEDGKLAAPDGYTTTLGEMVPEFEQAALALKPGEISGLVKSTYGYHIILRGEVADLQSYADQCREYQLDQELEEVLDAAEILRADALDKLNVADFFDRYVAYQNAVMAQNQPAETDPVEPAASDGVG